MTTCKRCPAPGATYQRGGRTIQRYFCPLHWAAYLQERRQLERQAAGVPDGWKVARTHWLKPPPGMTRVVLDGYRNRATVYRGGIFQTTHWRNLKRMNSLPTLRAFYVAIGYRVTADKRRWCVLIKEETQ